MLISKESLEYLSANNLMLSRHPDGTWMVFRMISEGWSEGTGPDKAVENWRHSNLLKLPVKDYKETV